MLRRFFENLEKNSPKVSFKSALIFGFSAGLYPLIYIYSNNFSLLSSWYQFLYLLGQFVLLPALLFVAIKFFVIKLQLFVNHTALILTFFNLLIFSSLIIYATYGLNKKLQLLILVFTFGISFLLFIHIRKLIRFQLLLAGIGVVFLLPSLLKYYKYSDISHLQNGDILKIKLNKTPNIYLIQPDGYVGFSEITKSNYNFDNSEFNNFLKSSGFTLYPNYRSNYPSTLSSNSALFGMKHHFYNYDSSKSELLFARDIIVGNNSALSILKNNGYTTSLILENAYLLVNRPSMAYDYCNINFNELSVVGNGFELKKNITKDLEVALEKNIRAPYFYFIEKILPGHIATYASYSEGMEVERLKYLEKVKEANRWLTEMVNLISKKDPNGLIIIASDHGGYVGFDYTAEAYRKPEKNEDVYSMFSSLLAIKWPENEFDYERDTITAVNLFKIVFSNLSDDQKYFKSYEADNSYLKIYEGENQGIFEIINNNEIIFKEISN